MAGSGTAHMRTEDLLLRVEHLVVSTLAEIGGADKRAAALSAQRAVS